MSSNFLTLILLISLADYQQIFCQEIDSRTSNDKTMPDSSLSSGGGQSRNIYSQKHLSPHRMMHFGKRPALPPPLGLITNEFVDLYPPRAGAMGHQQQHQAEYPYSLFFDVQRNRVLEAVPEFEAISRNRHLMDVVENLLQATKQEACDLKTKQEQSQASSESQLNSKSPLRLMKLINADGDNSYESVVDVERQQQQQEQQQSQGEQTQSFDQQQQEDANGQRQEAISVVGRSVPWARGNEPFDLSKAHISSLLFGRRITDPPSSLLSLGNFIKKAEPQKMTFMHFG